MMSRRVRRGPKKGPDEVIVEVMARRGIDPTTVHSRPGWPEFDPKDTDSIMGSWRYVRVRGYGYFFEPLCNRHWRSPYSWCVIDLRQQRIIYRYSQQCRQCEADCKPDFKDDAKEKMAEYACRIFLGERTRFASVGTPPDTVRGHHEVDLCEMCQSGCYCVKLSGSNSDNGGQSSLNNSYSYMSQVSRPTNPPVLLDSSYSVYGVYNTEGNCAVQYSNYSTAYYGHYGNHSTEPAYVDYYNTQPANADSKPPTSRTKKWSDCTIL